MSTNLANYGATVCTTQVEGKIQRHPTCVADLSTVSSVSGIYSNTGQADNAGGADLKNVPVISSRTVGFNSSTNFFE